MTDPDLVQVFNPRSKTYTVINRLVGRIEGHLPQQSPQIPLIERSELRTPAEPDTVEYCVSAVWDDGRDATTVVRAHSMLGAVWLAAGMAAASGIDGEPSGVSAEVRRG